jgi:hypothetical protein
MHGRLSDEEYFATQPYVGPGGVRVIGRRALTVAEINQFREIIAPLEERAGKPLNGPGLRRCQRAFQENPRSFVRLATEALERGTRNCLGLLITMVKDGEERWESSESPGGASPLAAEIRAQLMCAKPPEAN